MTQPRFPYVDASKDFFVLLLAFFFHWNFTLEILTNRKSYTGKYYTGKYTYWKMIHRNFVTQELLYRNLSYTGKTNQEKVSRITDWRNLISPRILPSSESIVNLTSKEMKNVSTYTVYCSND